MKNARFLVIVLVGGGMLIGVNRVGAQDWPQWRGPTRDNKVSGFTAPQTWPPALTQKWKVTVGLGDASPVLVGDKVYVFTRQGGDEVILCLDAGSGKVLWQDKYPAQEVGGAARPHPGPRSTPAVAEGKICTLGVGGVVSCLDAATGKLVWRKDTKAYPRFFTSSSPLIAEGKCIIFVGKEDKGALTAYELASGEVKWEWTGGGSPYGSPALMTVEGTKQVVTPTVGSVAGISLADGKLLWQVPFGGAQYVNNEYTPIIDGSTVIVSGSAQKAGTVALKIEKTGTGFAAKELWKKEEFAAPYNTPVLKNGLLFGLTSRGKGPTNFFCMNAKTGEVLWTDKAPRGECGTILDAGSVLLALTSDSQLVVLEPSNKEYKELAKYKVADKSGLEGTWAYPIIAGNRAFVKDRDSLALWTGH